MHVNWILKPFIELSTHQLYAALQLRNEVFVVEQACAFQDADGMDEYCHHLLCYADEKLVAYTRLVPPGAIYTETSIGRVVTSPSVRGKGIGRELMHRSIAAVHTLFGNGPIKIGAQLYLLSFYQSFGFADTGHHYLEDGIPHLHMLKPIG